MIKIVRNKGFKLLCSPGLWLLTWLGLCIIYFGVTICYKKSSFQLLAFLPEFLTFAAYLGAGIGALALAFITYSQYDSQRKGRIVEQILIPVKDYLNKIIPASYPDPKRPPSNIIRDMECSYPHLFFSLPKQVRKSLQEFEEVYERYKKLEDKESEEAKKICKKNLSGRWEIYVGEGAKRVPAWALFFKDPYLEQISEDERIWVCEPPGRSFKSWKEVRPSIEQIAKELEKGQGFKEWKKLWNEFLRKTQGVSDKIEALIKEWS